MNEKTIPAPVRKRGELSMLNQEHAAPLEAYPSIQIRVMEWIHWYLSEKEKSHV